MTRPLLSVIIRGGTPAEVAVTVASLPPELPLDLLWAGGAGPEISVSGGIRRLACPAGAPLGLAGLLETGGELVKILNAGDRPDQAALVREYHALAATSCQLALHGVTFEEPGGLATICPAPRGLEEAAALACPPPASAWMARREALDGFAPRTAASEPFAEDYALCCHLALGSPKTRSFQLSGCTVRAAAGGDPRKHFLEEWRSFAERALERKPGPRLLAFLLAGLALQARWHPDSPEFLSAAEFLARRAEGAPSNPSDEYSGLTVEALGLLEAETRYRPTFDNLRPALRSRPVPASLPPEVGRSLGGPHDGLRLEALRYRERLQAFKLLLEQLPAGGNDFLICGAGELAISLIVNFRDFPSLPRAVIEANPSRAGKVMRGVPIIPVEEAPRTGVAYCLAPGFFRWPARERLAEACARAGTRLVYLETPNLMEL